MKFVASALVVLALFGLLAVFSQSRGTMMSVTKAAKEGNIESLERQLSQSNIDLNQKGTEGLTALMFAALQGHEQAVEVLLSKGADPNILSQYGWTALMFAASNGHDKIVRVLLEAGADPNFQARTIRI